MRPQLRSSPTGIAARLRFEAPADSAITAFTYTRRLQSIWGDWEIHLRTQAGEGLGDSCVRDLNESECAEGQVAAFSKDSMPVGTTALELVAECTAAPSCLYGTGPLYDFAVAIYSSEVTIEENVDPSVSAPVLAGGGPGGWFGPSGRLTMSGQDTLGIRRFEVLDGDRVAKTVERTCVDWSVLPCAEPAAGLTAAATASVDLGELGLEPGVHQLSVRAVDGAGNAKTTAPIAVSYDATPQTATGFVGDGTAREADRVLQWGSLGFNAPAVSAVARICTGATENPTACREQPVPPAGSLALQLADGETATVQITTTDAAGNVGTSAVARLTRDATAPAAPELSVIGADGNDRLVSVGGEAGSRVLAELCRGDTCTALQPATAPATLRAVLPVAGAYELRVTLTDAVGNTSVASTIGLARTALPVPSPTPTAERALTIKLSVQRDVARRRLTLRGTVPPGSSRRIAIRLTTRTRTGRSITRRARIEVPSSGRFTKRLRLPTGTSAARPITLTLAPTPAAGWKATPLRRTLRR